MRRLAVAIVLAALVLAGCGGPPDSPEHAACIEACNAQNKCAGAKQESCDGLCGARPKDCTKEYSDYWLCADAHLAEACNSFADCNTQFSKLSACVVAYCLVYALDSACYYFH
jgi:hypothetical protein